MCAFATTGNLVGPSKVHTWSTLPNSTSRRVSCEPRHCKEGSPMGLFFSAFVGGLIGTGLMDIAEIMMERFRITSGSG